MRLPHRWSAAPLSPQRELALDLAAANIAAMTPIEAINALFALQQRALRALLAPARGIVAMPERIALLAREVIERIAAGEVIERPVSVVRELIDNALDAGATTIRIEMQHGGLRLMRVTDDARASQRTICCSR